MVNLSELVAAVRHNCSAMLEDLGTEIDCSLYPDPAVFAGANCIDIDGTELAPPTVVDQHRQCQPLKHEFCRSLYNTTVVPNLLGQTSQVRHHSLLDSNYTIKLAILLFV